MPSAINSLAKINEKKSNSNVEVVMYYMKVM